MKKSYQPFVLLFILMLFQTSIRAQVFTDSNLPIVIINTDNSEVIPDDPAIFGNMKIIYKGEGIQNFITDQTDPLALNYDGRIAIEVRGSYSQVLQKKQYALTTKLADNLTNNNVSLLGMPKENDWILNGLAFEPSLIRDYLIYNVARNMGEYASRTQFCEVIVNGEYVGLYVLQEKIKADSNRVDISKIAPTAITMPALSGGYITKNDKTTGGDPIAFEFPTYQWDEAAQYIHDFPSPSAITPEQNAYVQDVFTQLSTTANSGNSSILNGYPSVIDIPSFVNFMLANELSSNADGYKFSTFYHKDKNGKLRAGPIWDFNLSFGNDLFLGGYDRSQPDVWQFDNGGNVGAKYWKDLFDNPVFKCYLSKRWHEATQDGQPMNLNTLYTFIDNTVAYISQAELRENQKWGSVPNFTGEITFLKTWLNTRITWMTDHIGPYSDCSNVTVPKLVITKINYNPVADPAFPVTSDREYIAIQNTEAQDVSLDGIYFRNTGFVYQFPPNQTIAANSTIYLAGNSSTFLAKYGFLPFGEFSRHLSNSDQNLVMADAFGNVIDNVHYYDSAPWPIADGNGSYLQLTDTALDNDLASSWTASDSPLSTEVYLSDLSLNLAPNPAHNFIELDSKLSISSIEIFDVNGRKIKSIDNNSSKIKIDISTLVSGIYFVKVISEGKSTTKKLIKL